MLFWKKQKNTQSQASDQEYRHATEELYKRNVELANLYKKVEDLNHELADANEKLKSVDRLKTEFLSLASHQLRSPLTAIKGYASMLLEGAFGKVTKKQEEAVKRVYTSAEGLTNLVEDLLNVSKIEQGGMKYEFMPTDLCKLLTDVVNEMKIPAESKRLELRYPHKDYEQCMAIADPIKIKQVFLNLIDNSIKYTSAGFVEVALTSEGNTITFTVRDSGIGMSAETKAKLFEKFSRGVDGGKMNTGGSGLGLYLAKQIALAHKGDIAIDSEGEGKGTTFTVTIPTASSQTK